MSVSGETERATAVTVYHAEAGLLAAHATVRWRRCGL